MKQQWALFGMGLLVALPTTVGCSTELETGTDGPGTLMPDASASMADAAAASTAIPDASLQAPPPRQPIVGMPEFVCEDGQKFSVKMPCGLAPIDRFEEYLCDFSGPMFSEKAERSSAAGFAMMGLAEDNLGVPIPLSEFLPILGIPPEGTFNNDGQSYSLKGFSGEVVFFQASAQDHGFLGRFSNAGMIFESSAGTRVLCTNPDGIFWAVPSSRLPRP